MGLLPQEYELSQKLSERFKAVRAEVVKDAFNLFDERAMQHDAESPFWHRYPFGDQSYAQMVYETAGRLVSAVRAFLTDDKIEDRLLDLINWATMWLAWRRMVREGTIQDEEVAPSITESPPVVPSEPVTPRRKRLSLKKR